MNRIAALAEHHALGFDTVATITPSLARGLRAAGMRFAVRYLGSLTADEADAILGAGLALMPVTYAGVFDGGAAVYSARVAGIAPGTTVWLDLEAQKIQAINTWTAVEITLKVNAWAKAVRAGGFDAGLYVGAGAMLTSGELYRLAVDRYWHSLSRVVDRLGNIAEPDCGWSMYQLYPSKPVAGVLVDVNVVQEDFRGRVPTWTVASSATVDRDAPTERELPETD